MTIDLFTVCVGRTCYDTNRRLSSPGIVVGVGTSPPLTNVGTGGARLLRATATWTGFTILLLYCRCGLLRCLAVLVVVLLLRLRFDVGLPGLVG